MKKLFLMFVAGALAGCVTDTRDGGPVDGSGGGAWRSDTGVTGVGGTGTGGTGQAGAGTSSVGIDRQRTTGTGTLTNQTNDSVEPR